MSQKNLHKSLAIAIGAAFVSTLAASPVVNASENPFSMSQLSSGYMVAEKGKEGKCGEGKCGGTKAGKEMKTGEGSCGGKKAGEGKCGGDKAGKSKEGKCGEGKCGGKK
jgi:uncharacterized low-complexity protein